MVDIDKQNLKSYFKSIREIFPQLKYTGGNMSRKGQLILMFFLLITMITSLSQESVGKNQDDQYGDGVATFSILGFDPETGEVGGAVQSRVFSVGNGVLWGEANVGVVATQAIVDVSYGPQALALLRKGVSPAEVVKQVWEADPDPHPKRWTKHGRQVAVMNARGEYQAFTGSKASEWAGHKSGKYVTAQGNILAGEQVLYDMVTVFENTKGHLSLRLLAALEAGQAAGGDKRGMQSAAMLIVKEDGGVWLNNDVVLRLQVEDHPEPIKELRRLVEKALTMRNSGK